jgi:hypothetical protein
MRGHAACHQQGGTHCNHLVSFHHIHRLLLVPVACSRHLYVVYHILGEGSDLITKKQKTYLFILLKSLICFFMNA